MREKGAGWPGEIGLARDWYEPHLERLHEDATTRRADLLQLEQIASGYASREKFLTELTLDPPDATSDEAGPPLLDEDYLILSTIHSAKGQEWKNVFVLNAVDGCIPSDLGTGSTAEIEEERRLLYVAMTRAKDDLHVIAPQRFFTHGQPAQGDRHVYAARTRFIPKHLLGAFRAHELAALRAGECRQGRARSPRRRRGAHAPDVAVTEAVMAGLVPAMARRAGLPGIVGAGEDARRHRRARRRRSTASAGHGRPSSGPRRIRPMRASRIDNNALPFLPFASARRRRRA